MYNETIQRCFVTLILPATRRKSPPNILMVLYILVKQTFSVSIQHNNFVAYPELRMNNICYR